MKKAFFLTIFSTILLAFSLKAQTPTAAQTSLKYVTASSKYQVCVKFNQNGPVSIGSSLISLVFPGTMANQKLVITPVNGGGWDDSSVTYDEAGKDYHGISTTGQGNMAYGTAGTELILFEFSFTSGCQTGVRLWDPSLGDKTQTNDGTDYISNLFTPANNNYILTTNYGTVPTCPGAVGGDLELKSSFGSKVVSKNGTNTYTLTVYNKEKKNQSSVQVKAPLPTGFTYVSQSPTGNAYNSSTGVWDIGAISSTQDSVSITVTFQATEEGSHVFVAEISNMNGTDPDSTPNNNIYGEDDLTQNCVSVPVVYCFSETINFVAEAPTGYSAYQWYSSTDGVSYTAIAGATAKTYTVTATGFYKYTLDGSSLDPLCGSQSCCPVVVERAAQLSAGVASPAFKQCLNPGQVVSNITLADLLTGETAGGTWSIASGTPGANFTSTTGVLNPNGMTAGTYTFTYTVGSGPCVDTEVVTVIILGNCCPPKICTGVKITRITTP